MKLAIMQPYFFPYIGYWQLIHAVDRFVAYDMWTTKDYCLLSNGVLTKCAVLSMGMKFLAKIITTITKIIRVNVYSKYKKIEQTTIHNW
jgi:hypothetical protein